MSLTNSAEIVSPAQWAKPRTIEERIIDDLGADNANLAMAICDQLAVSTVPLITICCDVFKADQKDKRQSNTALCRFNRWKLRSDALHTLYTRARIGRADAIADEIIEIVDTEPDPLKAKVRMDARKWAAGKFNRQLYGDDPIVGIGVGVSTPGNEDHARAMRAELERRIASKLKAKKNSLLEGGEGVPSGEIQGAGYNPPPALGSHAQARLSAEDAEVVDE